MVLVQTLSMPQKLDFTVREVVSSMALLTLVIGRFKIQSLNL